MRPIVISINVVFPDPFDPKIVTISPLLNSTLVLSNSCLSLILNDKFEIEILLISFSF